MRKLLSTLALITLALAACTRGGEDETSPEPTDEPEATASVDAVADFALVGTIDEAFSGEAPDIDLPSDPTDLDEDAATPAPSPVGGTPAVGGVIRIVLDDASDDLTEACGLDTDDTAIVYWTTNTFFEPTTVLDDIEDEIEEETAGITGTIFRGGDGSAEVATPAPTEPATTSPAATGAAPTTTTTPGAVFDEDNDCVLVADQLGFTTTLPTPRPRVTPAPTAAPTATPARTATATPRRTATAEPPAPSPTVPPVTPTPTS